MDDNLEGITMASTKRIYQRTAPLLIVSVICLVLVLEYFAPATSEWKAVHGEVTQWGVIISACIFVYGGFTILAMHIGRVSRGLQNAKERAGRRLWNSSVFLATFVLFYIFAVFEGGFGGPLAGMYSTYINGYIRGSFNLEWVFHVMAVYTMFRFTSIEATLLFAGWIVSVLRMTTMYVYYVPPLMDIGMWVTTVPAMAVMRAGYLAMGVSAVVLTARALVWKEPGLIEVEAVE
jgi:hypothetical protein